MNRQVERVLVTGATGYVGGRLVPRLLEEGYRVRCLVRDKRRLEGRPWLDQVEVVEGDVMRPGSLPEAVAGTYVAYYLIHSMMHGEDFRARDLAGAFHFGQAAREAGVSRIVYLGGLGDSKADLLTHLRSRQDIGRVLQESGVPVTEFRAAIIVGSGSLSFEMIRYLTERMPVMVCPKWVFFRMHPIGIRDVLSYLVAALEISESKGRIIEIGGEGILTYAEMMQEYARVRKLRRWLVRMPILMPALSSHWVHWVTPIPKYMARPLIEGVQGEVRVRDDTACRLFPHIRPMAYRQVVEQALYRLERGEIETAWSDALSTSRGDIPPVMLTSQDGMILERRQLTVRALPKTVYRIFTGIGGERGWFYANWTWRLRGLLDRMIGGVGLRRGRRHPNEVRVGDALDFWRAEVVDPGHLIRLQAEMKVPGLAWLQFEARPQKDGQTQLFQTAFFAPKGLWGLLYWYILYPIHKLIFSGMIRRIGERAETAQVEGYIK